MNMITHGLLIIQKEVLMSIIKKKKISGMIIKIFFINIIKNILLLICLKTLIRYWQWIRNIEMVFAQEH